VSLDLPAVGPRRDKVVPLDAALDGITAGMTVLVGGWGDCGTPVRLIAALAARPVTDLTVIITGSAPVEPLNEAGMVRHMVTSFATYAGRAGAASALERRVREGSLGIELCSQGILAERIRAGGAGIAAFYVEERLVGRFRSTGETRVIDGKRCVLETALRADVALIGASLADRSGNLHWADGERNFNDPMAYAADLVVVEAFDLLDDAHLPVEYVMAPGLVVDRLVAPAAG